MQATNERAVVGAVDAIEYGDQTLSLGIAMLQQDQVYALHLAHVLGPRDVIDHLEKRALQTEEEVIELAPRMMLERASALMVMDDGERQRLKAHVRIGRTVSPLIRIRVSYEADVLIVGTHARRGMERVLLDSTSWPPRHNGPTSFRIV